MSDRYFLLVDSGRGPEVFDCVEGLIDSEMDALAAYLTQVLHDEKCIFSFHSESDLVQHDLSKCLALRLDWRSLQEFLVDCNEEDGEWWLRMQGVSRSGVEELIELRGERSEAPPLDDPRPSWDADACELSLGGSVVRQLRRVASKPMRILAAFEEEGWPVRIDNPLKPSDDLAEAIRTLNNGLSLIRFRRDGSGDSGVAWELRAEL